VKWLWGLIIAFVLAVGPKALAVDGGMPQPTARDQTAKAQPRAISVEIFPKEVKLARPFELIVRIPTNSEVEYDLPETLDLGDFVEVSRKVERSQKIDDHLIDIFRLKLAIYDDIGQVELPGFSLLPRSLTAKSDGGEAAEDLNKIDISALPINVGSVLAGVEQPQPREVAGPTEIWINDYRLLIIFGLIIVWILLAFLLREKPQASVGQVRYHELQPERLAHEIALEKLNQIVEDDLLRQGEYHQYFARISESLREYLGNRYGFFALDLTSRELQEELRDRPTPGLQHDMLVKILHDSDMVKFAKLQPTDSMASTAIDGAFAVVEATKQVLFEQTKTRSEVEQ
jgi:hypothetical protein